VIEQVYAVNVSNRLKKYDIIFLIFFFVVVDADVGIDAFVLLIHVNPGGLVWDKAQTLEGRWFIRQCEQFFGGHFEGVLNGFIKEADGCIQRIFAIFNFQGGTDHLF